MPKLVFHDSDGIDRTIDLGSDPTLIGRANECQVQTQDAMVSRRHARIVWDGGYWIEDLGSSNGVFIAGERVQRAPLRPGDEVRCGSLVLQLVPELRPPSGAPPPPAVDPMAAPANKRMMTGGFPTAPPPSYGAPPPYAPAQELGGLSGHADLPDAPPYEPPPAYEPPPYDEPPPEPPPPPRRGGVPSGAPTSGGAGELSAERARRVAAEDAVLQAEQRASTAESKLYDLETQLHELEQRAASAEEKAQRFEQAARDADRVRRQVDQLKADLRRARGGAPPPEELDAAREVGSGAEVAALAQERERLKQRVSDLEAEVGRLESGKAKGGASTGPSDVALPQQVQAAQLQRKIDQLTAENRRLRGGQPAAAADETSAALQQKVDELNAKLAKAEQERDEALHKPAAAPAGDGAELARQKRLVEQLTAENRRLRSATGAPPPAEDPRVAELTGRVAQLERDLAAAKSAPRPSSSVDPAAAAAAESMNDALSDLKGSLRACSDEVGVLGVEAPGDSVTVLKESLGSASEQLDTARTQLKELKRALKLP